MPITFATLCSAIASTWKIGKAIRNWVTDQPLKDDFARFMASLEHRRVLYAEWQHESMPAVTRSLSDILNEVRRFRSSHPENVELGVLLGELIVSMQESLDELHQFKATTAGEIRAYKELLKIRIKLAGALAILCGKTGVLPHGRDLEKFIMDSAMVRPRA